MGFETDARVQEQVEQLEARQKSERDAIEREVRADQRRRLGKSLKNRILFYTALAFAAVLVWQKLHFVVIIPGSFTALALILVGVFAVLYGVLSWLSGPD